MAKSSFKVAAIGRVRTDEEGFFLEIDEAMRPALEGLDGFGTINVLWWCDQVDQPEIRRTTRCSKPYRKAPAQLGIFATRSPVRPNPVALTAATVLAIDHQRGIVRVAYIDAEDGTPIIDIKPYHPCTDRVRDTTVPDWCAHWPECVEESAIFDWEAELIYAR